MDKIKFKEIPSKIDTTDGTTIYNGYINDSGTKYGITKKVLVGNVWTTYLAGGVTDKAFEWDDRADLNYIEKPLDEKIFGR